MSASSILIVEGETVVAANLANELQQLGYAVVGSATTGEGAIELAREHRPALVLMASQLAGPMDGIAAAGVIQRELDLPVILLTPHLDSATLKRAKTAQVFGCISHPFEGRALQSNIEVAISRHRAEQQVRQQRDQKALAEAHQRTLDILESISDGFFSLDRDYRVTYINDRGAHLVGKSRAELLNKSLWASFPEAVDSPFQKAYERVLEDRVPAIVESFYPPLNKWFEARAYPSKEGLSVFYLDITERKRREDTLKFLVQAGARPGEDFFQALARHLAEGLGMDYVCIDRLQEGLLEARTVAVFHNGQFEDNVSYTLKDTPCGQVVGQTICCFPKDVCHLFPNDAVLAEMSAESYVGATLWNSQGQPIGLIAVIGRRPLVDTSLAESILQLVSVRAAAELERRQAEQALAQSEARFAGIVNSAMDAIVSVDAEQRIVLFNLAAEKMFGRKAAAVVGLPLTCLLPERFSAAHTRHLQDFQAEALTARRMGSLGEIVGRRANGEEFPVEASISHVESHGQSLLTAILRDVTDRKEAERVRDELMGALTSARDELERRVQDRTADLQLMMEMLHSSELRYRMLFEAAPLGIVVANKSGRILDANPVFCQLLGITLEEAKAQPEAVCYAHPGDRRRLLRRIQNEGMVQEFETFLRRKDGRVFPAQLQVNSFTLGGKRLLLTMVQDLTRRKQAEKRLHGTSAVLELFATKSSRSDYLEAAVRLLHDLCDCGAVGIRLLDAKGCLPYAAGLGFGRRFMEQENASQLAGGGCACLKMLQGNRLEAGSAEARSASGFFCNNVTEFLNRNPAHAPPISVMPCVKAGFESIGHVPICFRGHFLGSIHLADRHPNRFTPENIGFIDSVASFMGEALHRFEVEESLLEKEELFRSLFEKHDAMMLLMCPHSGALVDANPAAAAFYGCTREKLRTLNIRDLGLEPQTVPPSPQATLWKRFETPTTLGSAATRTVEVYSSTISLHRRPLVFAIIHDVTERKLLERQIVEISEKERQRIGRDLHDSLGGHLTGVALLTKALAQTMAAERLAHAPMAAEIVDDINKAVDMTRAISHGLCPIQPGAQGLVDGLHEFVVGVRQRTGVACRIRVGDGVSIPDTVVAAHLFRIVEEAVQNALRHAAPKRIDIRLRRVRPGLLLSIWNDGRPLPARLNLEKGMGLKTIRFRANLVGGELEIRRALGGGTQVSCLVPDSQEAQERLPKTPASCRAATVKSAAKASPHRRVKKV